MFVLFPTKTEKPEQKSHYTYKLQSRKYELLRRLEGSIRLRSDGRKLNFIAAD